MTGKKGTTTFTLPSVEDSTAPTIRLRDGRRLGYAERGDPRGRPLLYFHGWPDLQAMRQKVLEPSYADGDLLQTSSTATSKNRPNFGGTN